MRSRSGADLSWPRTTMRRPWLREPAGCVWWGCIPDASHPVQLQANFISTYNAVTLYNFLFTCLEEP